MLGLEGTAGDPTWVRVRAQGWKAHLCRRAGCKGAPGKGPRWCSLPGRGECGCAKQGGWGLCRCESKGTTGTTGPSRLQGEEGEASPVESALGSWPPRKQGWGGRGLWACFPKRRPCVSGKGSLRGGTHGVWATWKTCHWLHCGPSSPCAKEKPSSKPTTT